MFDLDQFIEDCRSACTNGGGQKEAREVLARALSDPNAVMAALGEPDEAGFQTLHHSPELTVLNVTWPPYISIPPHNHGGIWAVIGIFTGREDSISWRRREDRIEAAGASSICAGDALPLGKDIIHSVVNPIPRLTGALHVYGGDFFADGRSDWDPETLSERPYDVERIARLFKEAGERSAPAS